MTRSDRRRDRGAPKGDSGDGAQAPSRRLAAIMFTDLVGYSALAHRDEALAIELLEMHRGWVREILPRFGGREIETVGDAFLVEFAGALAAVECAVAIQRRFAEHNAAAPEARRMELRVGIHLGDVEHKADKVFGDGVNIASRIHGMAKPGGICVSEDVHRAVRNRPAFQFASLGSPPLKNITTALELFELAPSMSLAPPAVSGPAKPRPAAPRRGLPMAAFAAGVAILAAASVIFFVQRPDDPAKAMPAIAVLPFENLSAEADSAFFTDGLHDTVIGHLARIHGLKVISRTSVMRYRDQRPDLRQVARDLGVSSILEGSVQRAGSKLRVVAQLIDAETDAHLWSSEYDREVADVFAVQADIASQVAGAVQVKLTPQEQASIQAIPTNSREAYDFFLKGRAVTHVALPDPAELLKGIEWLDEALALDPDFALAYATRSWLHDHLDWSGYDRSVVRRRQATGDAEKAVALAPNLPDSHVAMGLNLYHGSLDYPNALRALDIARSLAPGDSSPLIWQAFIYRRMDRWEDALANFEQAALLDPMNALVLSEYGVTLLAMRKPAEARILFDRAAAIDRTPATRAQPVYAQFLLDGDAETLARALAEVPREGQAGCEINRIRASVLDGLGRHYAAATAMGECGSKSYVATYYNEIVPKAHFTALSKWYQDRSRPPPEAAAAREIMEKDLAANPDRAALRMFLAMNLVMSGERDRALQEVERALKDVPRSRDAWSATDMLSLAAAVHANTGQVDRAFAELEESLARPGGLYAVEIRNSAAFAPLRSDPRYEKLLAGKPLKGGA